MRKLTVVLLALVLILAAAGAMAAMGDVLDCKDLQVMWDSGHSRLTYSKRGAFAMELNTGELLLSTMLTARNDTEDHLRIRRINETVCTELTKEFLLKMSNDRFDYWMEHGTYPDGGSPLTRSWETMETEIRSQGKILAPGESVDLEFAIKLRRKFDLNLVTVLLQDQCDNPEFE